MAGDTSLTPDRTVPLDIANRLSPEDRDAMTGVTLMNVPQGAQLSAGGDLDFLNPFHLLDPIKSGNQQA